MTRAIELREWNVSRGCTGDGCDEESTHYVHSVGYRCDPHLPTATTIVARPEHPFGQSPEETATRALQALGRDGDASDVRAGD